MAYNDLLLDEYGDLYINKKGELELTTSIVQEITIRLRWAYGEWIYNPPLGVPYFEKILVKSPNETEITNILREQILAVDDVLGIVSFSIDFDKKSRKATVTFSVSTEDGMEEGTVTLQ